jgi:hypothetical protein
MIRKMSKPSVWLQSSVAIYRSLHIYGLQAHIFCLLGIPLRRCEGDPDKLSQNTMLRGASVPIWPFWGPSGVHLGSHGVELYRFGSGGVAIRRKDSVKRMRIDEPEQKWGIPCESSERAFFSLAKYELFITEIDKGFYSREHIYI